MNMIYKKLIMVMILSIILTNCDKDSNVVDDFSQPVASPPVSSEIQSHQAYKKATELLKNVPIEFQWRDTDKILRESKTALDDGQFELSQKLSDAVIKQAKLMQEQQKFADENWQGLIPQIKN